MTDAAPAPATPSKRQRILTTLAVVFVLAGLGWWLLNHFVWDLREHTDDAYVAGHQVAIASQVPGTVVEVTVVNTALVEPGQVLVLRRRADGDAGTPLDVRLGGLHEAGQLGVVLAYLDAQGLPEVVQGNPEHL